MLLLGLLLGLVVPDHGVMGWSSSLLHQKQATRRTTTTRGRNGNTNTPTMMMMMSRYDEVSSSTWRKRRRIMTTTIATSASVLADEDFLSVDSPTATSLKSKSSSSSTSSVVVVEDQPTQLRAVFAGAMETSPSVVAVQKTDKNDSPESLPTNNGIEEATTKAIVDTGSSETTKEIDDLSEKLLNGVILGLSFGYAAYTIFNIDHGLTRGWTQSEIAMRIPLDTWNTYELSLAENPIYTKTLINVVIYLLGDWLSQTLFQKKNILDFDAMRTLRNGFIGLCFGPLVHEYYQFSDTILPVEGGIVNRLEKILMDQTIYLTVKCSVYIAAVGLLQGDDWYTVQQSVKNRIGKIVLTAWKFWPLVHCVTYGLIPARHRILWVNSIDLIWNAILASMSQQKNTTEDELQQQEEGQQGESSTLESSMVESSMVECSTLESSTLESSTLESSTLLESSFMSTHHHNDTLSSLTTSSSSKTTTANATLAFTAA